MYGMADIMNWRYTNSKLKMQFHMGRDSHCYLAKNEGNNEENTQLSNQKMAQ